MTQSELTRPIIGLENRTPLEVFDMMCARIKAATPPNPSEPLREYVLLASYCETDNEACSEKRPCSECLAMCNVFDEGGKYLRELGPVAPTVSKMERVASLRPPSEPLVERVARALFRHRNLEGQWDELSDMSKDQGREEAAVVLAALPVPADDVVRALERLVGAMPVVVAYGEHPISDCDCPFCEARAALAKVKS